MSWIGKLLTSLVTDLREPRRYFHLNILQHSSTCHAIPHFNFPALFSLHLITAIASSSQSSGQNEGGEREERRDGKSKRTLRWWSVEVVRWTYLKRRESKKNEKYSLSTSSPAKNFSGESTPSLEGSKYGKDMMWWGQVRAGLDCVGWKIFKIQIRWN